jgi:nitroreductase
MFRPRFGKYFPQHERKQDNERIELSQEPSKMSDSLLFQRYRQSGLDEVLPANPLLEQMLRHRSVRAYRADPLPPGTLEALVAAAQSASTSSNLQVWSVVAVQDPQRKARLAVMSGRQAHIEAAPLFLVWLADLNRLQQLASAAGQRAEGLDHLEGLLLGVIDASLAAQNAMLAAEALGLAGVYIGGIRNQPAAVAAELGLPPAVMPVFGMCIGYEDESRPASIKPRLGQQAVLHHEQYDAGTQLPAAADYDAVMAGFYAEQGMKQSSWRETSVNRVRDAAALHGREHLAERLRQLGFALR